MTEEGFCAEAGREATFTSRISHLLDLLLICAWTLQEPTDASQKMS